MTYQPQRIVAPDGTEMVLVRADDYDKLVAAAALDEDSRDILMADRALARDEARYPAPVVDAILAGATPIKAWREHRDLTQADLARRSGVSATALNKIESGRRGGRLATRRAIAKGLDVPVSALDPLDD
jgi:DNA-binding XRE family transcriptional regulator